MLALSLTEQSHEKDLPENGYQEIGLNEGVRCRTEMFCYNLEFLIGL